MSERFDLGNGEGTDDLEDALRRLQQGGGPAERAPESDAEAADEQKRAEERRRFEEEREAERRESRDGIEGALVEIREHQTAVAETPRQPRLAAIKWSAFALITVGLVVAIVLALLPEAPPPPARSPEAAVHSFWAAVISGDFEAATYYYPAMLDRYGSRRQAALGLESYFKGDPPVAVSSIGLAQAVPESEQVLVSYEVISRSRRPRVGEAVVVYSGDQETGYTVVSGL